MKQMMATIAKKGDVFTVRIQVSEMEAKVLYRNPRAKIGEKPIGTYAGRPIHFNRGGFLVVNLETEYNVNQFFRYLEHRIRDTNARVMAFYSLTERDYAAMLIENDKSDRKIIDQIWRSLAIRRYRHGKTFKQIAKFY